MNRLVIGIVVWNNASDAIECAESLLRQTYDDLVVVFVDNNSNQTTVDQLKEYINTTRSKQVKLLQTGRNGGTAGGFTAVARWAIAHDIPYVGSLNADAIADEQWCSLLVKELDDHPKAGITTGTLLHRDGRTIDSTGDFYTTWGLPGPRLRDKPVNLVPKKAEDIFGATGGGFIARTDMYTTVGYYDEVMFMYFEDIDLSFRAQLYGYTVRYSPKAIAYHKRGASSGTVPGLAVYHTFKNLPILFTKNVPLALWPSIYPRFILTYTLILGSAIKNGNGRYAIKGWLASWRYLWHMFRERWKIQKHRKVSDQYISSIILHDIPPEQTGLRKFRALFTGKS